MSNDRPGTPNCMLVMVPQFDRAEIVAMRAGPPGCRVTWTAGSIFWKVAVTLLAASMVTWHVPVPVQAPDQPAKPESGGGEAVSVTRVPSG